MTGLKEKKDVEYSQGEKLAITLTRNRIRRQGKRVSSTKVGGQIGDADCQEKLPRTLKEKREGKLRGGKENFECQTRTSNEQRQGSERGEEMKTILKVKDEPWCVKGR